MSDYDDNYDDYLDQQVETRTQYSVGTTATRNSKGTTATGINETSTYAASSKTGTGVEEGNTSSAFGWWGGGGNMGTTTSGVGSASNTYDGLSYTNKILQKDGIDHEQKVKEGFSILGQGVELVHYETANMLVGGNKNKKIVWMDADILRICVAHTRPTLVEKAKGKVPYGVYIRDIAEVREGAEAYDFRCNPHAPMPEEEDFCMSLIGTECSICLQYPSKFARDWFVERFQAIIDDILSTNEKEERAKRNLSKLILKDLTKEEIDSADQIRILLIRGVQVVHHHPSGKVIRSYCVYDEENNRIVVQPTQRYWLPFLMPKIYSLHVSDIAEIRTGTHSIGFVRTNHTDKGSECLSLVGTEATLDLELATNNARDLFATKLMCFLRHVEQTNAQNVADNGDDHYEYDQDHHYNEEPDVYEEA